MDNLQNKVGKPHEYSLMCFHSRSIALRLIDEIEDETITSTWHEVYSDIQVLVGPITRARVKKFKEALNGLI